MMMASHSIRKMWPLGLEIVLCLLAILIVPNAFAGQVTLAWDRNTESDLAGYRIHYGNSGGSYTQHIDAYNVTTYTVTGLTEGLTYYFAATAYDSSGNESGYSNQVSCAVPPDQQEVEGSGPLSQSDWIVEYVDSEERIGENGSAENAFDGNKNSFWHTKWYRGADPLPHEIRIDLGGDYLINGFKYLPRQDMVNGRIADYEFYVSPDGVSWGAAVAAGRFPNTTEEQTVSFPAVPGAYVRLVALKEVNGNPWTSVAELNVIGASATNLAPESTIDSPSGNVTISAGGSVDFRGSGSDPDWDVPLSYSWDFGDPSIPVARVQNPGLVKFLKAGTYTVKFTVTDAQGLSDPSPATRMVTVRGVSGPLGRSAWKVKYVDSQELVGENGAAVNVFDGNRNSIWHSKWYQGSAPLPHQIQIDLGGSYVINGFKYLPRQDMANGRIADYQFYVSADGVNWGTAVAAGRFPNTTVEQTVSFPEVPGRYVRLVALKEVNGKPWTSMAELNVLGY
jgi:hypothetical protein